jgi:hypothetical protein
VAIGDLNGDGKPDLVTANANSSSASVLLGNGDGTFGVQSEYGTENYPYSVAIGDLNGDGKPDLVTANVFANRVAVLLGNGDGTFGAKTDFGTMYYPYSVAIGDLNGDGKPDLVTANYGDGTVSVMLGNGDGTFGVQSEYGAGSNPRYVAIGDLNGDGKHDLAVANYGDATVSVLLGNGDGTFGVKTDYGTGNYPYSVALGDLNGDGKPDLAVANYGYYYYSTVSVLLGNGDGTFGAKADFATGGQSISVAIGDFNGDGKPDLAVSNVNTHTVSVLLGSGDGTFGPKSDYGTGNEPSSVATRDLNGDGKPDLATANISANTVSVLLGNGDGTFGVQSGYGTGTSPWSVAIGDLNGDGKPDLATANADGNTVTVLINTGGGGVTPTLLSLFEASWTTEGIELRWQFGVSGRFLGAKLERSNSAGGPWDPVSGERRAVSETAILLDRGVESGRAYYYRLVTTQRDGSVTIFGSLVVTTGGSLNQLALLAVAPSPTRDVARIDFSVAREARVRLSVLDVQGRRVAQLADAVYRPGRYQAVWDGRNERGRAPAGLYLVRCEWPGQRVVKRLLLVP